MDSSVLHLPKKYRDPLRFAKLLWPDVRFYNKQVEVIYSVRDNVETIVPAGHELGKDFVAGFIALWAFITHREARIVTTSVKDDHLRVLWGEIGRFIDTSRAPLTRRQGGPLLVNHREIKKYYHNILCKISYLKGLVSEKGEGMQGHHAAYTLLIIDEASGVDDVVYDRADSWADRKLILGNCYSTSNFFYRAVEEGDILLEDSV